MGFVGEGVGEFVGLPRLRMAKTRANLSSVPYSFFIAAKLLVEEVVGTVREVVGA